MSMVASVAVQATRTSPLSTTETHLDLLGVVRERDGVSGGSGERIYTLGCIQIGGCVREAWKSGRNRHPPGMRICGVAGADAAVAPPLY